MFVPMGWFPVAGWLIMFLVFVNCFLLVVDFCGVVACIVFVVFLDCCLCWFVALFWLLCVVCGFGLGLGVVWLFGLLFLGGYLLVCLLV